MRRQHLELEAQVEALKRQNQLKDQQIALAEALPARVTNNSATRAAIRVQASARGHAAARSLQRALRAARKIQSFQCGLRAQRKREKSCLAAVTLQAAQRRHSSSAHLAQARVAAMHMQAAARGWRALLSSQSNVYRRGPLYGTLGGWSRCSRCRLAPGTRAHHQGER